MQLELFPPETGSRWVGRQVIWGYSDPDSAPSIFRVLKFLFCADRELVLLTRASRGVHFLLACSFITPCSGFARSFLLTIPGCFPRSAVAGAKTSHSFFSTFWLLSSARSESRETFPGNFPGRTCLPGFSLYVAAAGLNHSADVALFFRQGLSGCQLLPAPVKPEANGSHG